jgi:SAM-dependent methyltransferase
VTEYIDFSEYYDLDHAITEDIPFYLELAHQCGSPVLELACGTGRVLVPLARAGFAIYGVDISDNMLAVCRQAVSRFGLDGRVSLSRASMVDFRLPRQDFKLAFVALRSFMHLLTPADQLGCLRQVYAHLEPGGYFVIGLIAPDPMRLAEAPSDEFQVRREFELPNGHHVVRKQRLVQHDSVTQVRRFDFRFEERDRSGNIVRDRLVPLLMRYSFPDELESRLREVGFRQVETLVGYDGRKYDGTGEMVVVAQRATGA